MRIFWAVAAPLLLTFLGGACIERGTAVVPSTPLAHPTSGTSATGQVVVSTPLAQPTSGTSATGEVVVSTPLAQPTSGTSATGEVAFGPLSFEGLYCWRTADLKRRGAFALFNPTESPVRFHVGRELGEVHPGVWRSGYEFFGDSERCRYELSINRADDGNGHLDRDYELAVIGAELPDPGDGSVDIVQRFFSDVNERNLTSLAQYADPPVTSTKLAQIVSWLFANEPIAVEVESCANPEFDYRHRSRFLVPVRWTCDVVVPYARGGGGGAGRWLMKVTHRLDDGRVLLDPGSP